MGLDFRNTCPEIDDAVKNSQDALNDAMSVIQSEMDDLRALNAAMRDQAEEQIEELEGVVLDLEEDITRLELELENVNA